MSLPRFLLFAAALPLALAPLQVVHAGLSEPNELVERVMDACGAMLEKTETEDGSIQLHGYCINARDPNDPVQNCMALPSGRDALNALGAALLP
jgi:hypothetical protein